MQRHSAGRPPVPDLCGIANQIASGVHYETGMRDRKCRGSLRLSGGAFSLGCNFRFPRLIMRAGSALAERYTHRNPYIHRSPSARTRAHARAHMCAHDGRSRDAQRATGVRFGLSFSTFRASARAVICQELSRHERVSVPTAQIAARPWAVHLYSFIYYIPRVYPGHEY